MAFRKCATKTRRTAFQSRVQFSLRRLAAHPLENKKFYPLEEFNEKYRGGVTYWKFDRKEGRIDPKKVLLPLLIRLAIVTV